MRDRNIRRIINGVIAIALMIALLWLTLRFIEARGLLDEQFGDTGGWGAEGPEELLLSFGDKDYITTDDLNSYLLIGTDGGGIDEGEGFNGELADFIVLLLVDNTTEKYAFYQIDRNTMVEVDVPDYGTDTSGDDEAEETGAAEDENAEFDEEESGTFFEQICIAHWYGKTDEERNNNLVNAVSDLMGGLQIDGYYTLNMADIDKVNDALGGVTVSIDTDMRKVDPAFKKGETVLLTGKQAEAYLRARSSVGSGTNRERMSRQRQYMQSAYSMLVGQLRENPEYINDLYDQLEPVIQSDGEIKLSELTNQIVEYTSMGMLSFDGKVEENDTLGDGEIHEEFYVRTDSIVAELGKVMKLSEDIEAGEEEEAGDTAEEESAETEENTEE